MFATLRQRDFALLWLAGLISVAGDFALIAALPVHAFMLTGSAAAAGGVFAATLVPRVLLGSVAGVYVDRWDRKRTMVNAATIAGPGPSAVAVAAAFMVIAGFPAVAFIAAGMGIVQVETVDAFRGRVSGVLTTIQGLSTLAGLVIGTLAIDRLGIVPVLSAGAVMWIVGGLIASARLPYDAGQAPPDSSAISM